MRTPYERETEDAYQQQLDDAAEFWESYEDHRKDLYSDDCWLDNALFVIARDGITEFADAIRSSDNSKIGEMISKEIERMIHEEAYRRAERRKR